MASLLRALLVVWVLEGLLSQGNADEEIVEKPQQDNLADVLFVGGYAEHKDFAVYADGKRQQYMTTDTMFEAGDSNSLRLEVRSSHLIAIVMTPPQFRSGERPPLGIIASLEQHTRTQEFATTDATWRCRHGSGAMRRLKEKSTGRKWFHPQYDDSHWPTATVLGNHGQKPWDVLMDISSSAKWIWANTTQPSHTVLCRGWVSHDPDVLSISVDSHFTAYGDGRLLGNGSDWEQTYRFAMPGRSNHLLAVHAWQDGEASGAGSSRSPGILASLQTPFPPGGVSNQMWKCRRSLQDGEEKDWMRESFDDSRWKAASVVEGHYTDQSEKGVRIDISQHANWVWAAGKRHSESERDEVFCRATKMSSTMHAMKSQSRGKLSVVDSSASKRTEGKLQMKYLHPRKHFEKVQEVDISRLDPTAFFRDFLSQGRPFVVRGGIKSWPAYEKWTDEYLMSKVGNDQTMVTHAPDNIFYFYGKKHDMTESTVGDFLSTYRDPNRKKNLYLAQHPLQSEDGTKSKIRDDVKQPPFTKFLHLEDAFVWMGGGDQVTPVHFDNSENVMCMVAGRKHIRIFEPGMSNFLYPLVQNKNTAVTSQVRNASNRNQPDFPEFAQASSLTVTLEAGDLFFLPAYWWHEVTSFDRNIAVNWWFNTHSYVLDAVYNKWIDELPQTQWGLEQDQQRIERERQMEEQSRGSGGERRGIRRPGDEL
ncbi:uncharacterized protein LOC135828886 [Sycon ciliatum]|uniref:uncharacterized protein LOC135828886 n=1 Tax=Sycon ciliatum TaxID=27933 RepID=UPI0031F5F1B2